MTSKIKSLHLPTHTVIHPSKLNGLSKDSVALVEQMTTMKNDKLYSPICFLNFEDYVKVYNCANNDIHFYKFVPADEWEEIETKYLACVKKYFESTIRIVELYKSGELQYLYESLVEQDKAVDFPI